MSDSLHALQDTFKKCLHINVFCFFSELWPDLFSDEDEHPTVQKGEAVTEYQTRTEQYWITLARSNMGPDAKDKKVAKVALAMAKVFYEDQ